MASDVPVLTDAGFTDQADGPIAAEQVRLLAATLDADPALLGTGVLPLPWHWACFPPAVPTSQLGADGHPRRRRELDGFPQRMWVGGRLRQHRALRIGDTATRASRLASADRKDGSSGSFWLVTISHEISQRGAPCIEEEQDIVLRAPSAVAAPGPDADSPDAEWLEERLADPVLLFRYSALTFNSHRIHYDAPYATAVEGYPDLVVQGPLTATLLCGLASRRLDSPLTSVEFRARAPLFANRRFWLTGSPTASGAELGAVRGDGQVAMTMTVTA